MTNGGSGSRSAQAAWRLMWVGGGVIVTAAAVFVTGFLLARAYLVPIGAATGAAGGYGIAQIRVSLRQRNLHRPWSDN